jgi:hypothetical protein
MLEFFWTLAQRGKTVAGALLTVLGTGVGLLAQLSPEDLAALTAVAGGVGTAGQILIVIGLLDKLRKLSRGKPAL